MAKSLTGLPLLSTKDAREWILGMIRASISGEFTITDAGMDVSECLLASMEFGVKCVSWAMVKNELSGDGEYKDLVDWIGGGCTEQAHQSRCQTTSGLTGGSGQS